MSKWTLGCVVLCGVVIAGGALHAHHSLAGVYALGKEAKVHGTFKAFKIVNPHSSMKVDVKNADGSVTEWSFVGGSATASRGSVSRTDRMLFTSGTKSPSRAHPRPTARVRLGSWSRSPTRTATRSASDRQRSSCRVWCGRPSERSCALIDSGPLQSQDSAQSG